MKSKMKKLVALALATIMVLAMGITAAAQQKPYTGEDAGTSNITIKNPKVGITYKVYKVFDATETGSGDDAKIAYTLRQMDKALPATTGLEADVNGYVTVQDGVVELNSAQAAALRTYAESLGEPIITEESDGTELVFSNLPYGYYLIVRGTTGEENSAITIDSTTPNMVIYDKNPSAPTVPADGGKKVDGEDGEYVQIGQSVSYTVTFNTTNYETKEVTTTDELTGVTSTSVANVKIEEYTVTDTLPSWLENPVIDSVLVKWTDSTGDHSEKASTETAFTNKSLRIDWVDANGDHLYPDGAVLEIKYHATVAKNIVVASANTNKVTLTWTGNSEGIDDEVDVYSASITINKYNGNDKTDVLSGAKFVLLDKAVGANGVIPEGTNYYVVDADGKITGETVTDPAGGTVEVTTGIDGKAVFYGLKPGTTYYLLETEAPTGFNKKVETTPVIIGTVEGANEADVANAIAALAATADVSNNAGVELPSTGGIGTTIFYVVGGILVVAAGVLLITKKRMSKHN